jgi:hypothetical protein
MKFIMGGIKGLANHLLDIDGNPPEEIKNYF